MIVIDAHLHWASEPILSPFDELASKRELAVS